MAEIVARASELPDGTLVEDKVFTGSVHYRLTPDPEKASLILRSVLSEIAARHGIALTGGRLIFELRPKLDINKGVFAANDIRLHHIKTAVFLGDDITDVDGFRAIRALRDSGKIVGGFSVAVCASESLAAVIANSDFQIDGVPKMVQELTLFAAVLKQGMPDEAVVTAYCDRATCFISGPRFGETRCAVLARHASLDHNTGTVEVGQTHIVVELADTPALQARGLGYRDELAPDTGMLFVFSDRSTQTFWMRGMRFCLDIIWIDGNVVTGAAEKVCPEPGVEVADLQRYSSEVPVDMVLEVPAGWMEINGMGVGTVLKITLPEPSQLEVLGIYIVVPVGALNWAFEPALIHGDGEIAARTFQDRAQTIGASP